MSCDNYRYKVKVKKQDRKPLTDAELDRCQHERTQSFGFALMDFARWDMGRRVGAVAAVAAGAGATAGAHTDSSAGAGAGAGAGATCVTGAESVDSCGNGFALPYQWPRFVLDLVLDTARFRIWRKDVDQAMGQHASKTSRSSAQSRRHAYFVQLMKDCEEAEEAERAAVVETNTPGSLVYGKVA